MRSLYVFMSMLILCELCAGGDRPALMVSPVIVYELGSEPASTPWYHTRHAPAVGNGRLWAQSPFLRVPSPVVQRAGRGPEYFGADPLADPLVAVRVGTSVIGVSPWNQTGSSGLAGIDRARSRWLRDRGYVGGVRTFTNPRSHGADSTGSERARVVPEPSGWFRRPAEMPRTKSVEQVRYSVPPGMHPTAAARLQGIDVRTARRD